MLMQRIAKNDSIQKVRKVASVTPVLGSTKKAIDSAHSKKKDPDKLIGQ